MRTALRYGYLVGRRPASLANVALVATGSVLALSSAVEFVTGAVIVGFGFAGVVVSLLEDRE